MKLQTLYSYLKNKWPIIDVTRKSVEETAASIIKILEIKRSKNDYISIQKWSKKKILDKNKIPCKVVPSNVDEDQAKLSLQAEGADPQLISKNLAEIKSIKVSKQFPNELVLGADSVISLNNELINKPNSREEAMVILKKLNGAKHYLISSVCISKNRQ